MITTIFATKLKITQTWDKSGARLPVTIVKPQNPTITQVKTTETDGYRAIQVGIGTRQATRLPKPQAGQLKQRGLDLTPRHFKEVRLGKQADEADTFTVGTQLKAIELLQVGDRVKVTGRSKGRGFTGVVKRWGFAGGPRTHGQSDRMRAPGSIGQGTTPGRVYKGKKMAGRSGGTQFTLANLTVVKIDSDTGELWLKGTVPGHTGTLLKIQKTGTSNFPGLPATDPTPTVPESTETESQSTPDQVDQSTPTSTKA